MKTLKKIERFNEDEIERLLTPVWNNDEIIGETGVIIGEEGSIQLLGAPIQSRVEVKNIFGDVLYEEGIDYTVEGNKVKRIAGPAKAQGKAAAAQLHVVRVRADHHKTIGFHVMAPFVCLILYTA